VTANTVTRCPALPTGIEISFATPPRSPATINVPVPMAKVVRAKIKVLRFMLLRVGGGTGRGRPGLGRAASPMYWADSFVTMVSSLPWRAGRRQTPA